MTSSLRDLKVYTTYPHSCSYLEDREATTLFVDPRQEVDQTLYSNLSVIGFRRSGNHLYRPHCEGCEACIPARIPVNHFAPNRSQRRTLSRNRDLEVELTADIRDEAAFELYRRYIEQRHHDGDMYPPDREQYLSFLDNAWECTRYFRFYEQGRLVGVSVVDELLDGLSAIYTFFAPDAEKRSLGRYAVLWQVEKARELNLDYLYLGYWIRGCRKMAYKSEYRPLQLYLNGRWSDLR
ncbi:arginyltransferase [Pseudohalioglobus sediminis]|uniref:Aspartate/glutamate leucyltransferase n=1 Tax=Pseudohalioglobus sediminis TaxID=2606449 RepID=A0A5B0X170_9GAMM|nr:arginyltransferase [Pseudohalioglobus sediminis]KAA1193070.1 arginyltransferase [Pseudohalioglobus sediminis]